VKRFGIDVVIIEPGLIRSEFPEVMRQPTLRRSGDGPYAAMAQAVLGSFEQMFSASASPPSVVADAVARALRVSRPKARYVVGARARPLILLRQWLGDQIYDWGVMRMMG
jgi:NAD(P)-dependent dehydrogenase (short-subunit alcohol dehydrogenase family)